MGVWTTCVKYLLFVFNLIFLVIGLAIIIIGGIVLGKIREYTGGEADSKILTAPILVLVIGCIIFVVAFFGCCGSIKENSCLIKTFCAMMVVLLIFTIAIFIVALVMRAKTYDVTSNFLSSMVTLYGSKTDKYIIDHIQANFSCCGAENYTDWQKFYTDWKWQVPESCCESDNCTTTYNPPVQPVGIFYDSCDEVFGDYIYGKMTLLILSAVVVFLIQLIGIVFACVMIRHLDGQYEPV